MDTEQIINRLLDRIERNAVGSAKRFRMYQEAHRQRLLNGEALVGERMKNRSQEANMRLALAKIAEWEAYASALRSAIDPTAVLPDMPEPLEFPIPF